MKRGALAISVRLQASATAAVDGTYDVNPDAMSVSSADIAADTLHNYRFALLVGYRL